MEKMQGVLLQLKTPEGLFNATAESVYCSLEKFRQLILQSELDLQKNFVNHIENFSEKFIDYRYRFKKLTDLSVLSRAF